MNVPCRCALFATALFSATICVAQPMCVANSTAFDTASVKPSQLDSRSSHMRGTSDSLTASGSVFSVLENAYELHSFQVVGGPSWVSNVTWDIVAKVDQPEPEYQNLPNAGRGAIQRQRMQAVLAQRFNLKCHVEMRQLPVYDLVLAKGGSKLKRTPADATVTESLDTDNKNGANHMEATGITIETLSSALVWPLDRIVIDKTGLTGAYDFTLTYTTDNGANATGPTIYTALEEQLGLKLESSKGPVPVLIIDSIDRPSEN